MSKMTKEQYDKCLKDLDPQRHAETDVADSFRGDNYKEIQNYKREYSYSLGMDVLPELIGQPWNNLALSYVTTLRPSCIRVLSTVISTKWGPECRGAHCDCHCWRVTIWLGDDDRVIESITQEMEGNSIGLATTNDMVEQLKHQKQYGNLDKFPENKTIRKFMEEKWNRDKAL